jgi:diguanylate cyclase (GGDEF)-like protein
MAQEIMPDLLLIDLMMPHMDGYEAILQLRNDTRTSHLPIIIVTAKSASGEVVTGFESGADDYITKPFNTDELLARVKGHLRRAAQRPVHNPLTGLAGNVLLTEELKYRIKSGEAFALLYLDLDNFKAFNDVYGFARGDQMLKLVADVLIQSMIMHQEGSNFIGHIGGDDFAIITTPRVLKVLCTTIIERFDKQVRYLYDKSDLERGYLEGTDRDGVVRHFPLTSISIGVVTNVQRSFDDYEEVSRIATEMKQYAKTRVGSCYEIDRRKINTPPVPTERRRVSLPVLLLLSANDTFCQELYDLLHEHVYQMLIAHTVPDAHTLLSRDGNPPDLVIVDAHLEQNVWDFCVTLRAFAPELPLLTLISRQEDQERSIAHGATMSLLQPCSTFELVEVIDGLLSQVAFYD